jgi:transcriptional regulator with XRE-family HTH domain
MVIVQNPAVGRRKLRTALRRAREAIGWTQEQVAEAMDWSLSKVIRIEAGSVGVSTNDVKALLQLYRIDEPEQVGNLVSLARLSRQRPWWTEHRDLNPGFTRFLGLEAGASTIRMFQISMIPGLFQTEAYAREVSADAWIGEPVSPAVVQERITVRLIRQREILERADHPELTAVIDEGVLRHLVGDAATMRAQLQRLIALAERPNVAIHVVPFTAGVPLHLNSFVILGFADPEDTDVVFLEGALDQVIEDAPQMRQYGMAFQRLERKALDQAASIALIKQVADELS